MIQVDEKNLARIMMQFPIQVKKGKVVGYVKGPENSKVLTLAQQAQISLNHQQLLKTVWRPSKGWVHPNPLHSDRPASKEASMRVVK